MLLLLSHFSRVWLCAIPQTAVDQAPPSLGFSRQEHWSGLPLPSPMHESVKSLSRVRPSATPWTAACQASPSMGFSRQEYWSGVPLPSPISLRYQMERWLFDKMREALVRKRSESHSVVSDSFQPYGLYSLWNSPGQNIGVGSPTQESNQGLLHCRWILYQLSYQGSPH